MAFERIVFFKKKSFFACRMEEGNLWNFSKSVQYEPLPGIDNAGADTETIDWRRRIGKSESFCLRLCCTKRTWEVGLKRRRNHPISSLFPFSPRHSSCFPEGMEKLKDFDANLPLFPPPPSYSRNGSLTLAIGFLEERETSVADTEIKGLETKKRILGPPPPALLCSQQKGFSPPSTLEFRRKR